MVHEEYNVGIAVGQLYPKKTRGLLGRGLPENHFIDQAKRSMLLDLACMKRCSRDVKSRVSPNLDQTKFRGIESPLGLLKGKVYRLAGSRVRGSTHANAGMRGMQTHKVPSRTPNTCIQSGGCHIFDRHPFLTESPSYQPHALRQ